VSSTDRPTEYLISCDNWLHSLAPHSGDMKMPHQFMKLCLFERRRRGAEVGATKLSVPLLPNAPTWVSVSQRALRAKSARRAD